MIITNEFAIVIKVTIFSCDGLVVITTEFAIIIEVAWSCDYCSTRLYLRTPSKFSLTSLYSSAPPFLILFYTLGWKLTLRKRGRSHKLFYSLANKIYLLGLLNSRQINNFLPLKDRFCVWFSLARLYCRLRVLDNFFLSHFLKQKRLFLSIVCFSYLFNASIRLFVLYLLPNQLKDVRAQKFPRTDVFKTLTAGKKW